MKARLALLLYQILTFFLAPLGMLYLIHKKRRDPPYGRRKWELLGFMPVQFKSSVWFHTVSVGEVLAARPVIEAFVRRHRKLNVIVTTTTTTGAAAASKIHGITQLYAPLDSPAAVWRFFRAVKPRHLFIMETELWPCLLHQAQKRRTLVTVFNARMPEKTCRSYEKHLSLVKPLIADPLNLVICQTPEDASRFARIGVPSERIFAVNSLKYDLQPDEQKFARGRIVKRALRLPAVIGAISTHDGEERLVLEQFAKLKQTRPELKFLLVPRHMSGTALTLQACQDCGLAVQQRSQLNNNLTGFTADVLIGDSFGEMEFYLGLCDAVFMGGSFIDIGGHNPLEPAYFSLPCITGPYYYNFKEQFERLIDRGGAYLCPAPERLCALLERLLAKPETLQQAGLKALEVQQAGRGAVESTLQLFEQALNRPARPQR